MDKLGHLQFIVMAHCPCWSPDLLSVVFVLSGQKWSRRNVLLCAGTSVVVVVMVILVILPSQRCPAVHQLSCGAAHGDQANYHHHHEQDPSLALDFRYENTRTDKCWHMQIHNIQNLEKTPTLRYISLLLQWIIRCKLMINDVSVG